MKKKNQRDPLMLLEMFQKNILSKKPILKEMITEVNMMKFKIKPVQGDFSDINFENTEFIEILWSLGKLDEFFQSQYQFVREEDRGTFFTYFDSMQKRFQEDLNKLNLRQKVSQTNPPVLEMEIFKDRPKHKKAN